MKRSKRVLKRLANNHRISPDDLLIRVWYSHGNKFRYLENENSIVKTKDLKSIKGIISEAKSESLKDFRKSRPRPRREIKNIDFPSVGKITNIHTYLSEEDVIRIHLELAKDFYESDDPISPPGIKDHKLLQSAVFRPKTGFEGVLKYPTVETSAASLMSSISNNHSFHNGNKRTALVSLLVFLDRYNICLICTNDELFRISIMLADHKLGDGDSDDEVYTLAKWVNENSKWMKKGERPITLRRLKQILSNFKCVYNSKSNMFERNVDKRNYFGISSSKQLVARVPSPIIDGTELDKSLMNIIRKELELDSEHGVDTEMFYGGDNHDVGEFIIKYRKVLSRLSRY